MSSWGNKLESKLATLAATSSKETMQTLAKWIVFNRKRVHDFSPVLRNTCLTASPTLQPVILGVIHEVLLAEKSTSKWERLEDLRITMGEQVLLPIVSELGATAQSKLPVMLKEWDDANVFGGPTLLNQLKKALAQQEQDKTPEPTPETEHKKDKPSEGEASKVPPAEKAPPNMKPSALAGNTTANTNTKDHLKEISYDFESQGIPAARVEPRSFLEPCRAIATLQIARDLRNDGAVQLSSLLSGMPQDVRAACAAAAEQDNHYETDEATARDFSLRINPKLLDVDLDEQLQNVQTFRNIVERQRQARQQLIQLLVQSRCKFGADEAAQAFLQADRAKAELLRRKQILTDAMELEGLDVMEDTKKLEEPEQEFIPLTWYEGQETDSARESKRPRTE